MSAANEDLQPGARVIANGNEADPGTVVAVSWYPHDLMLMRPVIWDSQPHDVYFLPRSMLSEYKTERQQLEELALRMGFPEPPKENEPRYFARKAEWEAALTEWGRTVKKLAHDERNDTDE